MIKKDNDRTPDFIQEIEAYDEAQEAEQALEEEERKQAEEAEKRLVSDFIEKTSRKNAIETLKENIETIQQGYYQVWRTGIESLDEKLDGGFHPKQLITLGAIASQGKTSLALQIADNVASSGKDVLIFSLEMDSDELLAKSISRTIYLSSCGDKSKEKYLLKTQDILSGRVGKMGDRQREVFDEALKETERLNQHLFYYVGENDVDVDIIRYMIELHKKARNQSPLVIVDYLQILRPTEDALSRRLDKRLLTDDDITKLKVIARDFELPVLVISAFNRESYSQPVTTSSFKESSGIEYSADVLLGLQYQDFEYKKVWISDSKGNKKKVPESKQNHMNRVRELLEKMETAETRPLELKILKQRNGTRGSVYFDFIAPYNAFIETGTESRRPSGFIDTVEDIGLPDFDDDEEIVTLN